MKRRSDRRWRSGAAGAAIVSGLALGLQDALQPKEPLAVVIEERGGEAPGAGLVLFFHPQIPEATLVLVR